MSSTGYKLENKETKSATTALYLELQKCLFGSGLENTVQELIIKLLNSLFFKKSYERNSVSRYHFLICEVAFQSDSRLRKELNVILLLLLFLFTTT